MTGPSAPRGKVFTPTLLAGLAILAGLLPLALGGKAGGWPFLAGWMVSAAAFALAVLRLERDAPPLRLVWSLALIFRLVLLLQGPVLSTDVYRYLWDGHLVLSGVNPYAEVVQSPALDAYATPLRARVEHAWMDSPYLPAAQVYFAALELIAPQSTLARQAAAAALDLATGALVLALLRATRLAGRAALIYLWNPLVVVEFAQGAHVDAFMLALMMLAFWLALARKPVWAGLAWGAAALTKGLPLLLLPLLARKLGWRGLLSCALALAAGLAVFWPGAGLGLGGVEDGRGIFGASRIFLAYWRFNGGVFDLLQAGLSTAWPQWGPALARMATGVGILAAAAWAGARAWRLESAPGGADPAALLRLALVPGGVFVLFSAALHPWYAAVLAPFLPFLWRSPYQDFLWPWLYFYLALPLSYLAYLGAGPVEVPMFVRWLEYLPLNAGLAWLWVRSAARSAQPHRLF